MNTIFIGGSRNISRLPIEVRKRLDNVVASGHQVIVGDANGADKAVQKHLSDIPYDKVMVFCSGDRPRNNVAGWRTHAVSAPKSAKGFQFYAIKDREMAKAADFGLMIWDGKSPGTLLNVLRLIRRGKIAVLFSVPDKSALNIKSADQWREFLAQCSPELVRNLKDRATPEEWSGEMNPTQASLLPVTDAEQGVTSSASLTPASVEAVMALNGALAEGDISAFTRLLGSIARERGMSHVARETGLARESLYRSLDAWGNPEFATILKVLSSVGLCLEAKQSTSA